MANGVIGWLVTWCRAGAGRQGYPSGQRPLTQAPKDKHQGWSCDNETSQEQDLPWYDGMLRRRHGFTPALSPTPQSVPYISPGRLIPPARKDVLTVEFRGDGDPVLQRGSGVRHNWAFFCFRWLPRTRLRRIAYSARHHRQRRSGERVAMPGRGGISGRSPLRSSPRRSSILTPR